MKLYLAIFLLLYAIPGFSQTGDTLRTESPPPKTTLDTIKIPFDTNYIKSAYRLSNTSETFGISNWIWNDKRNLGEILNERPGFRLAFLNDGGRNVLFYYQNIHNYLGVFKDGIQYNDNLFGGFDIENISVNEIDTIEEISSIHSYLYGINSQVKAINIITKDVFQPELFSQLRFTQDRYGSENADVYFSQSLSRKFNWQIGANKHSLTGRYANTDFDVWRARFRTNWFISPKANLRFNLNYANFERGLNGGLVNSAEDTLRNPELAQVRNPDAYEKLTNFFYDLSFNGRLFKDKNSLTKIKLYSQNSLREYRDPRVSKPMRNFHVIQYGADLKQNFPFRLSRQVNADLLVGGNAYFNLYNFDAINPDSSLFNYNVIKFNTQYYSIISKLDLRYNNFYSGISAKLQNINSTNTFFWGIDLNYDIFKSNDLSISLFSGLNSRKGVIYYWGLYNTSNSNNIRNYLNTEEFWYMEAGVKIKYRDFLYVKLQQMGNAYPGDFNLQSGLYEANLVTRYFDVYLAVNQMISTSTSDDPSFFVKSDISYHNFFFNNNLNFRTGFNMKYMSSFYAAEFSDLTYGYRFFRTDETYVDHVFNMDFYIGARIGSANIAFTFANIFDNFNYDTFLYPWDDRGGAFNSLSRFSITWDFLN